MSSNRSELELHAARRERKRDWLMLIPATILFALTWHFTSRERAVAVVASFLLVYVLATTMWDYHRERWLWLSLAVIAATHIVIICLLPLRLPAGPAITYILPTMMADGFIMWGVLRWLAARLHRNDGSDRR